MAAGPAATDAGRLTRARRATATIFLVTGMVFGNWVSRVPDIKQQSHADTGSLGTALLGIAVGAVLARPWCGQLTARLGSRVVTRVAIVGCCLALILPALATNALMLGLALTVLGAALGSIDIAMNTHAVAVEKHIGRPIMSSFHGVYSTGGLLGAVIGGRAAALALSPRMHFTLAAVALAALALVASSWLLPPSVDVVPQDVVARGRVRLSRDRRFLLILLGIIGLCSMAGEGAVGDWGAVYLREDLGSSVSLASCGFAVYSLAMITGRLLGDRLVARWGDWQVITWASVVGGLGFALALTVGRPAAAIGGFIVLGLSLCLVVPVTFSKVGSVGGDSAGPGVAVVSGISGLGPIMLPPVIGFLAEAAGLPTALGAVSVLALCAAVLMKIVGHLLPPQPEPQALVAVIDG